MIQLSEDRYQELVQQEKVLQKLLFENPNICNEPKLTSTAKKYKQALARLVDKVEEVGNHPDFQGIFQIAYVHGFKYAGPNFADALKEAKKLLNR